MLSEFSVSAGTVFQPQLPTVRGTSTTILDAKGNVAEDVELLEHKPVHMSVYCNPRTRLVAWAIVMKQKRLRRPVKA